MMLKSLNFHPQMKHPASEASVSHTVEQPTPAVIATLEAWGQLFTAASRSLQTLSILPREEGVLRYVSAQASRYQCLGQTTSSFSVASDKRHVDSRYQDTERAPQKDNASTLSRNKTRSCIRAEFVVWHQRPKSMDLMSANPSLLSPKLDLIWV